MVHKNTLGYKLVFTATLKLFLKHVATCWLSLQCDTQYWMMLLARYLTGIGNDIFPWSFYFSSYEIFRGSKNMIMVFWWDIPTISVSRGHCYLWVCSMKFAAHILHTSLISVYWCIGLNILCFSTFMSICVGVFFHCHLCNQLEILTRAREYRNLHPNSASWVHYNLKHANG